MSASAGNGTDTDWSGAILDERRLYRGKTLRVWSNGGAAWYGSVDGQRITDELGFASLGTKAMAKRAVQKHANNRQRSI